MEMMGYEDSQRADEGFLSAGHDMVSASQIKIL